MDTYSLLREFADSWMLLMLFLFFFVVIFWVMRPGSRETYEETASIPFRHETRPAAQDAAQDGPSALTEKEA